MRTNLYHPNRFCISLILPLSIAAGLFLAANSSGFDRGLSIGMNFGADEFPGTPGAGTLNSSTVAGAFPQIHWNNLTGANGNAAGLTSDSQGSASATSVSVMWSCPNTWSTTGRGEENNGFPVGSGDRTLMTGYLDTSENEFGVARVTVSGLGTEFTGPGYTVIVYAHASVAGRGGAYSIGSVTNFGTAPSNPASFVQDPGADHGDTGDYLVFSGLHDPAFTLTANAAAGLGSGALRRAPISALQIVRFEPPPPSCPGNALGFDGVDDYVGATSPTLPTGNTPYTIEAWIETTAMNAGTIAAWGNFGVNNQVNAFRLTPTGLVNYWWANDLSVSTPNLLGSWHHVAATFDGITRRILLDGVVVGSDTPVGHNAINANFSMGAGNGNEFFSGTMDEVRIWNVARNAAQIQATMRRPLFGHENGLVACYRLDEGSGVNAFDGTGNPNNTATLRNGPAWVTSTSPLGIVQILSGPNNVVLPVGLPASFAVVVDGTPPYQFQWKRNGLPIAGATARSYTIASVAEADDGARFSASVTNACGSTNSPEATLTVRRNPVITNCTSRGNCHVAYVQYNKPMHLGGVYTLVCSNTVSGLLSPLVVTGIRYGRSSNEVCLSVLPDLMPDTNVYCVTVLDATSSDGLIIGPNPSTVCFIHGAEHPFWHVIFERYDDVGNGNLAAFLSSPKYLNHQPDAVLLDPTGFFESPGNIRDNYGGRIFGYYIAPQAGNYFFWMSSDDQGATYIATDANPAHKVQICSEPG